MYDTIKISSFSKESNDEIFLDLEVDVSFDLSHNGIENVSIDSIWDVTTDDPKEIDVKSLTSEEISDLNARLEKEMSEKELEYEHDIYLSQIDSSYDDFKDDVG